MTVPVARVKIRARLPDGWYPFLLCCHRLRRKLKPNFISPIDPTIDGRVGLDSGGERVIWAEGEPLGLAHSALKNQAT